MVSNSFVLYSEHAYLFGNWGDVIITKFTHSKLSGVPQLVTELDIDQISKLCCSNHDKQTYLSITLNSKYLKIYVSTYTSTQSEKTDEA